MLEDDPEEEPEEENINIENFEWSADFSSFRGQREEFLETPGPKIEGTAPIELFLQIWDPSIMNLIETETNRYAMQEIEKASESGIPPRSRCNKWVETSVSELYRLMAIFILMGICVRGRVDEYWRTGILGMPKFRELMSLERFWLILRFLHFSNNEYSLPNGHPDRKLEKISTLVEKINSKFQEIYTPKQEISIDESLLLWKGHLSWIQCIRSKAARFGIKSYELCEAVTGYCIKFMFYTGKGIVTSQPLLGFTSSTAKIVLKLMQGFLRKGFTLFMDNFYNSIKLSRFLKRHKTDVVGTLNRRRTDTPHDIKTLNDRRMARGEVVSRHCGDVSVVAWKDVKLVTTVSTYHNANMAPGRRAGEECSKPEVIHTYNAFMGGVDLKDQKLSMYLLERKRGIKWYVKVFRRLLNISILNAYIIHCANTEQNKITHREFRYRLAQELIQSYGENVTPRNRSVVTDARLNSSLGHYPEHRPTDNENRNAKQEHNKRGRCARCAKKKLRKTSTVVCSACEVFLCIGQCWRDYHTFENLD